MANKAEIESITRVLAAKDNQIEELRLQLKQAKDKTYNGWTNYATWRVNLEIFDGQDSEGFDLTQEPYDLGRDLKIYAEELIDATSNEGLARDYALAFLHDVNWWEIAKHLIETIEQEA